MPKKDTKIICVSNQKGGVAKSTSVRNIAEVLKNEGYKVLCVDLDPQANLSSAFLFEEIVEYTIADLLEYTINGKPLPDERTKYINSCNGIDVIITNIGLARVESDITKAMAREKVLDKTLEHLKQDYDFIIIDTTPALGDLTINALACATNVIIPCPPEYFATMGLADLLHTSMAVKKQVNPKLEISGIFFTLVKATTNLHKTMIEGVENNYNGLVNVYESRIPNSIEVGVANEKGVSMIEYLPDHAVSKAYVDLVIEIVGGMNE